MQRIGILHGREATVSLRDLVRASANDYRLAFFVDSADTGADLTSAVSAVGDLLSARPDEWVAAARAAELEGVTTFDDRYVERLEQITKAIGVRGPSASASVWDKLEQRVLLNAHGASDVEARALSTREELAVARQELGPRVIVKPRRSSTGRGIVIADATVSDAELWGRVRRQSHGPQMVEQLMDASTDAVRTGLAPYVSVDTVSVGTSRHHFLLLDKLPLVGGFRETGAIGRTSMSRQATRAVLGAVDRALHALGVADRLTHTEVRMTSSGPQVIEVNGRLGGYNQRFTRYLSQKDACRAGLDVAVGRVPDLVGAPEIEQVHAGLLMLPLESVDPNDVFRAGEALRSTPSIKALDAAAVTSTTSRTVVAWMVDDTRRGVLDALSDALDSVERDQRLATIVDARWRSSVRATTRSEE